MPTSLPLFTQVLVIGGGPAGSYAATVLAREGFEVTLLEQDHFPRYHIGESLLPSCRSFLQFVDAEEKVKNHGFVPKPGAAVKLHQEKREGYTDFISLNPDNGAWNVIRSEFDDLLLRHAASCGVKVYEGIRVTSLGFHGHTDTDINFTYESSKVTSASWKSASASGTISFNWLVDASGRSGIMSTKYLKSRQFNKSLRNVAFWGYWVGASAYMPGTDRENAPWFEALTDETGWAWFIPLHNGTASVGVILSEDSNRHKRTLLRKLHPEDDGLKAHYIKQLGFAPGVQQLLQNASLESKEIRCAGDYSYNSSLYAGKNWRIAGDAGAFIDPFFSSGVHLALTGGLSAASTIAASIRGQCSDKDSSNFHNLKVGTSYTRFLLVVLSIYRHIRSQQLPVLSDVDEDNFDRAFHIFRPIIQGCIETDHTLTMEELVKTMDFCKSVVAPTQPEMFTSVAQRFPGLFGDDASVMSVEAVKDLTQVNGTTVDEEARHVLLEKNARRLVHPEYDGTHYFGSEVLDGFSVNLRRGHLGLVRAC